MIKILAIDPGQQGAFVLLSQGFFDFKLMPLISADKKEIDFKAVQQILDWAKREGAARVYLERAVPFAMGTLSAFNYGRGFAVLEIAISISGLPVTYIEPAKWTKEMHQGIAKDLKPKAKSEIAITRLFPRELGLIPKGSKSGKFHEGVVDALLIAGFGLRRERPDTTVFQPSDF